MSRHIRQAAVAGSFYPGDPDELRQQVDSFFSQAQADDASLGHSQPKALIVPHAGYIYSGAIATSAYQLLLPFRKIIKHVVLLGPAHRVAVQGLALSNSNAFNTPLGNVVLDNERTALISTLSYVNYVDAAHQYEHALEVQLPFLQTVLDEFTLVPIVVGQASAKQIAQVLDKLWGNKDTLIIISSDLSHFHTYNDAKKIDRTTVIAIEQLDEEKLHHDMACGSNPIKGLLHLAREKNLLVKTLDIRNSGDTAGDMKRVVGYGAFAFYETHNNV